MASTQDSAAVTKPSGRLAAALAKPRSDIRIKFISKYIATIGVDFGVRTVAVDDKELKVNFWDLSGYPEFFHVRNEFYKDTQAALLVYDVTSKKSFTALEHWLKEAVKFGEPWAPLAVAVCANKADLGKKRLVTEEEGRKWASEKGFAYFETSAKSEQNVSELFNFVFATTVKAMPGAATAKSDSKSKEANTRDKPVVVLRSPAEVSAFVTAALSDAAGDKDDSAEQTISAADSTGAT